MYFNFLNCNTRSWQSVVYVICALTQKLLGKGSTTKIVLNTTSLKNCSREEKKKKAIKLHRQFSHASKEKLKKLVKSSKNFHDIEFLKLIEQCCDSCEICTKFKKPMLKPIVCMPLSDKFNGVVCMDLKEYVHNKSWIFHMIDSATKFSAAQLVSNKKTETIIQSMFNSWITYFGTPHMFLTDNGGEFDSGAFRETCEQLNVQVATSAAYSPFSNGIVERNNATIYESMKKTVEDQKCKPEIALASAVSAKNSLAMYGGVSPNMCVFGHNTNFQSVLTDELPALNSKIDNDVVRTNMNARHAARRKWVEAESSEKIRRALRSKVRTYADVKYEQGEKVFYRKKDSVDWKGPATIIGIDGKVLVLRHGGEVYLRHACSLRRKNEHYIPPDTMTEKAKNSNTRVKPQRNMNNQECTSSDDYESDADDESPDDDGERDYEVSEEDISDHSEDDSGGDDSGGDDSGGDDSGGDDSGGDDDPEEVINNDSESENHEGIEEHHPVDENTENVSDVDENTENNVSEVKSGSERPLRKHYVKYKLKNTDEWIYAKVLSKMKKSGKYESWVNVWNDGADDASGVDWNDVEEWQDLPYPEQVMFLTKEEELSQEVVDAKERELRKLVENNVYTTVPYTGQKLISSKWHMTEKYKDNKKVVKARLVARGFEEDSKQLRTDSPTLSRQALRMIYFVSAMTGWVLRYLDFTSAFLQGGQIDRKIFLRPPRDVCSRKEVWSLKKCLYGLNDAPRSWYVKVKDSLISLGATQSIYDSALFLWHAEDGALKGIIGSHVDDFVYCGTEQFQSEVIQRLKCMFKIGDEGTGNFRYVGLNITQRRNEVKIDQNNYVASIEPIRISKERKENPDSLLTPEEKSDLKQLAGQMIWAASQTRPDVAYETCQMANTGKNPTVRMLVDANRAVSKLKKNNVSITFKKIGAPSDLEVEVYTDATQASLNDGGSQGGHIVFLKGRSGGTVPMGWQSKRLQRVTQSPLASETLALSDGADAAYLIASMVKEVFNLKSPPPIHCITDNKSLVQTLHSSKTVTNHRLKVDVARLRQMTQAGEISVSWVPGRMQLSDALTKHTAATSELIRAISG